MRHFTYWIWAVAFLLVTASILALLPSNEAVVATSANGAYSDRELIDRAVQIIERQVAEDQIEVEYKWLQAGAPSTHTVCGEMRIRPQEQEFRRFVVWPDRDGKFPWKETVSLEPRDRAFMNRVFLHQWDRCVGKDQ